MQEINKCKQGICVDLTNKKILWAKNEKIMNKMLEKVIEAYEKNNE